MAELKRWAKPNPMRPTTLILLALLLTSCGTPRIKVTRYTETTYAPTPAVEVLRTKPSEKPYEELGELSIQLRPSDEELAVMHLKEKAKSLGADALLIIGENSRGAVAMPMGTSAIAFPIRFLNAVAIRYKR